MAVATHLLFLTLVVMALGKPIQDDMLLYWRRSNVSKCVPFTVQTENCNRCVCGADGTPYCTKMDCEKLARDNQRSDDDYSG